MMTSSGSSSWRVVFRVEDRFAVEPLVARRLRLGERYRDTHTGRLGPLEVLGP